MRNILAVAGKELRTYFHSPIAYLVMTVWAGLCGFFFYSFMATYVMQSFRMAAMGAPPMSMNEFIIRPMFEGILTVVLLLLIPLITMRLYAEERKTGTIELLMTSPMTDLEIILGKFLGALALFAVLLAMVFLYLSLLFIYGNPNFRPVLANALGFFLFGGALLALGMWISTFTRNQIVAGSIALAAFLLLYVLDWVTAYSTGRVSEVISYMSLTKHFESFSKGVVDLSDLVYYLSVIVLGIFLTSRSVEALKGRP
ncbi:MAG TPA: ABC transporter permease subunit [Terriglobia bacterium]|nr:ABC transporter permease subunit [Terriglobia bacterium]